MNENPLPMAPPGGIVDTIQGLLIEALRQAYSISETLGISQPQTPGKQSEPNSLMERLQVVTSSTAELVNEITRIKECIEKF